jgi:hypothetical protein
MGETSEIDTSPIAVAPLQLGPFIQTLRPSHEAIYANVLLGSSVIVDQDSAFR